MIDLHVHTNHSDGRLTVAEVLKKAKEEGIKTISFCDHNVLGAYEELENMDLETFNVKIITLIEFDFVHYNKDFHMLGYNFDWKKMNKSKLINKNTKEEIMQEEREKLNFLKGVCKKPNIRIDEKLDIKTPNDKAIIVLKYNMMEFEENSQILDKMLGKDRKKSFARGFVHNRNSPFFIDTVAGLPTAKEVADLIHEVGGKVFLAHPFDYKDLNHKEYIQEIYNLGILDGIECIHRRHTLEQIEYIKQFCKERDLYISGGSDFHREGVQKLGYGVEGTVKIMDIYEIKKVK